MYVARKSGSGAEENMAGWMAGLYTHRYMLIRPDKHLGLMISNKFDLYFSLFRFDCDNKIRKKKGKYKSN